jgi:hypothetical protein
MLFALFALQAHRGEGGDAMDVDGEEAELLVRTDSNDLIQLPCSVLQL